MRTLWLKAPFVDMKWSIWISMFNTSNNMTWHVCFETVSSSPHLLYLKSEKWKPPLFWLLGSRRNPRCVRSRRLASQPAPLDHLSLSFTSFVFIILFCSCSEQSHHCQKAWHFPGDQRQIAMQLDDLENCEVHAVSGLLSHLPWMPLFFHPWLERTNFDRFWPATRQQWKSLQT